MISLFITGMPEYALACILVSWWKKQCRWCNLQTSNSHGCMNVMCIHVNVHFFCHAYYKTFVSDILCHYKMLCMVSSWWLGRFCGVCVVDLENEVSRWICFLFYMWSAICKKFHVFVAAIAVMIMFAHNVLYIFFWKCCCYNAINEHDKIPSPVHVSTILILYMHKSFVLSQDFTGNKIVYTL